MGSPTSQLPYTSWILLGIESVYPISTWLGIRLLFGLTDMSDGHFDNAAIFDSLIPTADKSAARIKVDYCDNSVARIKV